VEDGYEAAIRIGPLPDSGLIARTLQPYKMTLCAAPAYLRKVGTPRTVQELAKHNCLGFAYWRNKNVWRLRKSEQVESVQVKGRFTVNNGQALRMAAVEGLGIIMQPEILVGADIEAGSLVRILPDHEPPLRPMHIVYHSDRRATPKLRSFVDFVVESFG
jgi:DNA-binding transcriptional LysR family regulator